MWETRFLGWMVPMQSDPPVGAGDAVLITATFGLGAVGPWVASWLGKVGLLGAAAAHSPELVVPGVTGLYSLLGAAVGLGALYIKLRYADKKDARREAEHVARIAVLELAEKSLRTELLTAKEQLARSTAELAEAARETKRAAEAARQLKPCPLATSDGATPCGHEGGG